MNEQQTQKQQMRTTFLAMRSRITPDQREYMNNRIMQSLETTQAYRHAHTVCTYVSLADEVDTQTIIINLLQQHNKTVVVPKVTGKTLELYRISSLADLTPGVFGILEPVATQPRVSPESVDLFIIPGLVFDRQGFRIGYGKGYYDRLLTGTEGIKLALAYDLQMIDSVPHEPTDIPMDICITDNQIYRFP